VSTVEFVVLAFTYFFVVAIPLGILVGRSLRQSAAETRPAERSDSTVDGDR